MLSGISDGLRGLERIRWRAVLLLVLLLGLAALAHNAAPGGGWAVDITPGSR
jgi:hypothetical protein